MLAVSLVLIAFNLRPVFSSLASVLPEVMATLHLSPGGASLLTTAPVLCLGLFAPVAPWLARRVGIERAMLIVLVTLACGTALRGVATTSVLALGSIVAGGSIAIVNVLLPSLVKREFREAAARMTGLYTMALCGGAALGAGLTVPLSEGVAGSWPLALAAWAVPAGLVAASWAPQALWRPSGRGAGQSGSQGRLPVMAHGMSRGLWRDPLAWQVTLFMGLQSALAYCVFGWLAPILRDRGLNPVAAGLVVSVSVVFQTGACLVAPSIAVRGRDQRRFNLVIVALAVIGLLGCLAAPLSGVWFWAAVQGLGQGSLIAVALTLVVLRSPDVGTSARLSGMAQGIGYLLAAAGPLLVGLLRDWTGGFAAAGGLFLAIGVAAGLAGLGAGRNRHVRA